MKTITSLFTISIFILGSSIVNAQFFEKLEQKATEVLDKAIDKAFEKNPKNPDKKSKSGSNSSEKKEKINSSYESFSISGNAPVMGDPCTSTQELETRPGKYQTAEEYPFPARRAEYFKKMKTDTDKSTAKKMLESIQKLEQNSRNGFSIAGGFWEAYYSSEGYNYFTDRRLADYRFQNAFHIYTCVNGKVERNEEYSTVLRVYVNSLPLNSFKSHFNELKKPVDQFDFKDWKNYKAGVEAIPLDLFTYLEVRNVELIEAINSGKTWETESETHDHLYRTWFVRNSDLPLLIPVSRKEYLESLLDYYEREEISLPKSTNYEFAGENRNKYFGDLPTVLADKKKRVHQLLQNESADWLSKQAVINQTEDLYNNQKQDLPEYSSNFTFHRFYDGQDKSSKLYKYNPAYFSKSNSPAKPQFMSIIFRYLNRSADKHLLNNFSDKFNSTEWENLMN